MARTRDFVRYEDLGRGGAVLGHVEFTLLEAPDQSPGPLGATVGGVDPQSEHLTDRSPGVQPDVGRQLGGDARPPLLNRRVVESYASSAR